MMRWTTAALVVSLAAGGCGGRYDVGAMDGAGGSSTAGASNVITGLPTSGSSSAGDGSAAGGSTSAGPGTPSDALGPNCVPSGPPAELMGAYAEPQVVWARLQQLLGGQAPAPPAGFPATTTYAWAGDMVQVVGDDAARSAGPSASLAFLQQWLQLKLDQPADGLFQGPWAASLSGPQSILHVLLETPYIVPGSSSSGLRIGIFSEPSWLAQAEYISSRGSWIVRAVFDVQIPPPPSGAIPTFTPDPNLPDRQALAQQVQAPVCSGCHRFFDPPGFALGNYAADGSYRELDHGLPIDTATSLTVGNSDVSVAFDGIADFGAKFADSCLATTGISDAFLRIAITMNTGTFNDALFQASRLRVQQAFVNGGRSYAAFVKAYIQSPAGLYP